MLADILSKMGNERRQPAIPGISLYVRIVYLNAREFILQQARLTSRRRGRFRIRLVFFHDLSGWEPEMYNELYLRESRNLAFLFPRVILDV